MFLGGYMYLTLQIVFSVSAPYPTPVFCPRLSLAYTSSVIYLPAVLPTVQYVMPKQNLPHKENVDYTRYNSD
jgi:hypothetical protein